jgi:hypothetical protein
MSGNVDIKTFGSQMKEYESDKMAAGRRIGRDSD